MVEPMIEVHIYVTYLDGRNDTVHLITQRDFFDPNAKAVCGQAGPWVTGDETLSGTVATCKTCRKVAGVHNPFDGLFKNKETV